jgi:hypothetical protein
MGVVSVTCFNCPADETGPAEAHEITPSDTMAAGTKYLII